MTKRILFILITFIFVVLISGCVQEKPENINSIKETNQTEEIDLSSNISYNLYKCKNLIPEEIKKASCYANLAKITKNESICEFLDSCSGRDICYLDLAKIKKDISICDKIEQESFINTCYGIINKNVNRCTDKYCYFDVAVAIQNISICNELQTDEDMKEMCYALITENISLCKTLSNSYSIFSCCNEVAKKINDLNTCDDWSDIYGNSTSIKYGCYIGVARTTGNVSICKLIIDPDIKKICYRNLEINKVNSSICKNLKNELRRANCYFEVFINTGNPAVCENISYQDAKTQCYIDSFKIAKVFGLSICDAIQNMSYKDSCFSGMAGIAKNVSICEKINNEKTKDYCFYGIAKDEKEKTICERIGDDELRNICIEKIKS